ncbi:MAG: phosphomannomutase [Pelagibacterales bacterium]|nr:phosphomannomutase [Pelagibacterales bacterium]
MSNNHFFNKNILRAYDIRGEFGNTLNNIDAERLGNIFASSFSPKQKVIIVCRDGRLSSPELVENLKKGLYESGADVIDIGLGPSPMLYFAAHYLKSDGAIMVTGSHNPPNHNGFKIMRGKIPFFGKDILDIGEKARNGEWNYRLGSKEDYFISDKYIDVLLKSIKLDKFNKSLKVAWDPGNGAAGDIISKIVNLLPGEHTLVNENIDGMFPSHHPDPTDPKNLEQLINLVIDKKLDIGLAFDGDGDRLGVVSSSGNIVWGDQLLAFLSKEVLCDMPNSPIIADVKASQNLFQEIEKLGGVPVMWKTGHSFIKSKMKEISSPLAGEMSGHIFFADRYLGYDDGIYAALRVLELINDKFTLDNFLNSLPKTYSTQEIKIKCSDDKKFRVIEELYSILNNEKIKVNRIDGLRIEKEDGWWLLRASNTQAVLVARIEAKSKKSLKDFQKELNFYLNKFNLSLT